jgi:hypothetical protein
MTYEELKEKFNKEHEYEAETLEAFAKFVCATEAYEDTAYNANLDNKSLTEALTEWCEELKSGFWNAVPRWEEDLLTESDEANEVAYEFFYAVCHTNEEEFGCDNPDYYEDDVRTRQDELDELADRWYDERFDR